MHRPLSDLPLPSALRGDGRRSSYSTWFAVAMNWEDLIVVQWVFQALQDTLPLIISTQHPVLIHWYTAAPAVHVFWPERRSGTRETEWSRHQHQRASEEFHSQARSRAEMPGMHQTKPHHRSSLCSPVEEILGCLEQVHFFILKETPHN